MRFLHFWKSHERPNKRPAFLELRSNKNFIVAAVAMAIFTVCLPTTLTLAITLFSSCIDFAGFTIGYFSLWTGINLTCHCLGSNFGHDSECFFLDHPSIPLRTGVKSAHSTRRYVFKDYICPPSVFCFLTAT